MVPDYRCSHLLVDVKKEYVYLVQKNWRKGIRVVRRIGGPDTGRGESASQSGMMKELAHG